MYIFILWLSEKHWTFLYRYSYLQKDVENIVMNVQSVFGPRTYKSIGQLRIMKEKPKRALGPRIWNVQKSEGST